MNLREPNKRKKHEIFDPSTIQRSASKRGPKLFKRDAKDGNEGWDPIWNVDEDSFIVEAIRDHKRVANAREQVGLAQFEFLVRWKGYGSAADQWLPYPLEYRKCVT